MSCISGFLSSHPHGKLSADQRHFRSLIREHNIADWFVHLELLLKDKLIFPHTWIVSPILKDICCQAAGKEFLQECQEVGFHRQEHPAENTTVARAHSQAEGAADCREVMCSRCIPHCVPVFRTDTRLWRTCPFQKEIDVFSRLLHFYWNLGSPLGD